MVAVAPVSHDYSLPSVSEMKIDQRSEKITDLHEKLTKHFVQVTEALNSSMHPQAREEGAEVLSQSFSEFCSRSSR